MLGSIKEFVLTKVRTHGPGLSIPMFKSWVQRPLGYQGDHWLDLSGWKIVPCKISWQFFHSFQLPVWLRRSECQLRSGLLRVRYQRRRRHRRRLQRRQQRRSGRRNSSRTSSRCRLCLSSTLWGKPWFDPYQAARLETRIERFSTDTAFLSTSETN